MYGEGTLLQVSWSLAYFHLNWSMQVTKLYAKCKATSGYSILKVLSLCKHFITLATVPGLHPPTHLDYVAPV